MDYNVGEIIVDEHFIRMLGEILVDNIDDVSEMDVD